MSDIGLYGFEYFPQISEALDGEHPQPVLRTLQERDRQLEDYLNSFVKPAVTYAEAVFVPVDNDAVAVAPNQFKGDGVTDYIIMQEAVDYVAANGGGRLVVLAGTITLTGPVTDFTSTVSIQGSHVPPSFTSAIVYVSIAAGPSVFAFNSFASISGLSIFMGSGSAVSQVGVLDRCYIAPFGIPNPGVGVDYVFIKITNCYVSTDIGLAVDLGPGNMSDSVVTSNVAAVICRGQNILSGSEIAGGSTIQFVALAPIRPSILGCRLTSTFGSSDSVFSMGVGTPAVSPVIIGNDIAGASSAMGFGSLLLTEAIINDNVFNLTAASPVNGLTVLTGSSKSTICFNRFRSTFAASCALVIQSSATRIQALGNESTNFTNTICDSGTTTTSTFVPAGAGTTDQSALMWMETGGTTRRQLAQATGGAVLPTFINEANLAMGDGGGGVTRSKVDPFAATLPAIVNEANIAMASTSGTRRRLAEASASPYTPPDLVNEAMVAMGGNGDFRRQLAAQTASTPLPVFINEANLAMASTPGTRRRLDGADPQTGVLTAQAAMASTAGTRRQLATVSTAATLPAIVNEANIAMASTSGTRRRLTETASIPLPALINEAMIAMSGDGAGVTRTKVDPTILFTPGEGGFWMYA